jgi:hypothetical protein
VIIKMRIVMLNKTVVPNIWIFLRKLRKIDFSKKNRRIFFFYFFCLEETIDETEEDMFIKGLKECNNDLMTLESLKTIKRLFEL